MSVRLITTKCGSGLGKWTCLRRTTFSFPSSEGAWKQRKFVISECCLMTTVFSIYSSVTLCVDGDRVSIVHVLCMWRKGAVINSHVCGGVWLNGSAHWSLIIICHLSTVTSSAGEAVFLGLHAFEAVVWSWSFCLSHLCWCFLTDKRKGSPCILHLDPLEGIHKSFEGHVRRWVFG
jgi:hypothetical protein